MKNRQRYLWNVRSERKQRKYERWIKAKANNEWTVKARNYFKELGKHESFPNWPNICEQEKRLIMKYAGQSIFDKADCMFVKRMRDKIFGDDPLGFIQLM